MQSAEWATAFIRRFRRAARLGLEYPLEHRRYDQSEYEPFGAAAALDLPLSLHTATRRQGRIRGAGDKTLRDASSRATKAFYPALSLCDLIFSGVFERHPRLTLAIVEFELAWAPHLLSTMDYTYRRAPRRGDLPVQGPALAKAGDGMLPSDFFRRNVALSLQKDAIGIRLRDVIGPDNMIWDNMMWGWTIRTASRPFPNRGRSWRRCWRACRDDEQAKPAPDPDPGIAGGNTGRVYKF
jgi:hypothetical protein